MSPSALHALAVAGGAVLVGGGEDERHRQRAGPGGDEPDVRNGLAPHRDVEEGLPDAQELVHDEDEREERWHQRQLDHRPSPTAACGRWRRLGIRPSSAPSVSSAVPTYSHAMSGLTTTPSVTSRPSGPTCTSAR